MSRLAFYLGFAGFAVGCVGNLNAQQFPEPYSYQSTGYLGLEVPSQQYVSHLHAAPHAMAHQSHAPQGGSTQYHGAHGSCGCPSCSQEPSAFWTTYYRNTRWPAPFRAQDVNAVQAYFAVQRENGWKMHNTVGHVLFDPQNNCLTEAGKNHIRSILTDNPNDRRAVFVLQGPTPQHTAQRVESVQLAISALLPTGDLPAIYVTDRDAPGSSGAYQTAVTRAMMTTLPAPRLPAFNGTQTP